MLFVGKDQGSARIFTPVIDLAECRLLARLAGKYPKDTSCTGTGDKWCPHFSKRRFHCGNPRPMLTVLRALLESRRILAPGIGEGSDVARGVI